MKKEILSKIKIRAKNFEDNNDKYGLHYLIGADDNDNQVTEVDGHNSYCDDCINEVVTEYNNKLKNSPNKIGYGCSEETFKYVVKILMTEESSPERDDFCYCDNCGRLISTVGVLHTFSQEIEHWLDADTSVNFNELEDQDCFIINELIENAIDEYPELIKNLKTKIKLENKKQKTMKTIEVTRQEALTIYAKLHQASQVKSIKIAQARNANMKRIDAIKNKAIKYERMEFASDAYKECIRKQVKIASKHCVAKNGQFMQDREGRFMFKTTNDKKQYENKIKKLKEDNPLMEKERKEQMDKLKAFLEEKIKLPINTISEDVIPEDITGEEYDCISFMVE